MNGFFAWVMGILAAVIPGIGTGEPPIWNGYVEADYVYASAPSGGTIASIAVSEGQMVEKGQTLFVLASDQQQAQVAAAKARAEAAQATLDNLKTGSRSEEVDVIRASLMKAEADLSLAQQNFSRSESLFAQGLIPAAKLDQDRATLASAQAAVEQLKAQLKVSELPARDEQQIAAEANLTAAQADAANAAANLRDRTIVAPESGRVERLFFDPGEVAGAGVPVVSLLGDGAMKIKFYVNEADRSQFALGDKIKISCDGCSAGLEATVTRFASDPQFTPPIIYSRDERSRLVFLTEAVVDGQTGVMPGQPVTLERMQ